MRVRPAVSLLHGLSSLSLSLDPYSRFAPACKRVSGQVRRKEREAWAKRSLAGSVQEAGRMYIRCTVHHLCSDSYGGGGSGMEWGWGWGGGGGCVYQTTISCILLGAAPPLLTALINLSSQAISARFAHEGMLCYAMLSKRVK